MSDVQEKDSTTRRLIVSLTSYPARIGTLSMVLETIYAQTRQADEIVLWLAQEQFPEKEAQLPVELRVLIGEGRLTVRWCDDLKPHKKYYYTFQEHRNDLVVTIDDDILYPAYMLENLYQSYLRNPNAVSANRVHLMTITEQGRIMPYKDWIKETDVCLLQPSMQLLATGAAGVLYPVWLFRNELFDKEGIRETCLFADDLWLKAMELISNIPVVVAQQSEDLQFVPGSQKNALYHQNEDENQNDVQLAKISKWLDIHVEEGILVRKLMSSDIGVKIIGIEALCEHFGKERSTYKEKARALRAKLQQAYADKSGINTKLQQAYSEKSKINAKLQQAYSEKSEINAKLRQVYAEKSEINMKLHQTYAEKSDISAKLKTAYQEKLERGKQIKILEARIAELNEELQEEKARNSITKVVKNILKRIKNIFVRQQ